MSIPALWQDILAQEQVKFLSWDDGIVASGQKGKYSGKFGGRVLFDIADIQQEQSMQEKYGAPQRNSEWRRIRAQHEGQLSNFRYKVQVELATEYMFIEDLYVEAGNIPVIGNIRIGHMKEPFLFEAQTSSNDVLFMERAVTTTFSSGRNLGIMVHNRLPNSDLYWSVGAFRNGLFDIVGISKHIGYNFCGRLSGLISANADRTKFIHAGIGIKQSIYDAQSVEVSSGPEAHLAHKYISSGTLEGVSGQTSVSTEFIMQSGRASFQSEIVHSIAHLENDIHRRSSYYFPAAMGQLSFFLTKDAHRYKNGNCGYGGVEPAKDIFNRGAGAIEIAIRYSLADLSTSEFHAGKLTTSTIGLNWYPNKIARISTNYVLANVPDVGSTKIFQMRFQLAI